MHVNQHAVDLPIQHNYYYVKNKFKLTDCQPWDKNNSFVLSIR